MTSSNSGLSSHQRQHLKRLAHGLDPVVQLGAAGLTEGVAAAIEAAIADHELIKVKIGKGYEGDKKAFGQEVAQRVDAELCQVIGRVFVLFRQSRDPKRRKVQLPKGAPTGD